MRSILVGITLILFSCSVIADPKFAIQTSISHNGVLLGSPSLIVDSESEAGAAEEGKYELSLSVLKFKELLLILYLIIFDLFITAKSSSPFMFDSL